MLLVFLAGCGECKVSEDCPPKTAFTAQCVDKTCEYEPIPGICGNGICDSSENKCSCPKDCGLCSGKVEGTQLLKRCVSGECVEALASQEPIFNSREVSSGGDRFTVDTLYNQPFNIKSDTYGFTTTLTKQDSRNQDHKILRAKLTARTMDGRTITLGTKEINKPLWGAGSSIEERMILDFPTTDKQGELRALELTIYYEYAQMSGSRRTSRQETLRQAYNENFLYVNPDSPGRCPETCDDNNPGTEDKCGPETNNFCVHIPIPNTCGNFECEAGETKCTCAKDCGPCQGTAGTYLDYTCKQKTCVTVLKSEVTKEEKTIFDERRIGPVELTNKYKYNNPFDVTKDYINLEFAIYQKDELVGDVNIEKVRLIESQEVVAEMTANKKLSDSPTSITVKMPTMTEPEEERIVSLNVWYSYVQNGEEQKGNYIKQLDRITFIQPG